TEYQHQDKPLATFARTKQIVPKTLIRWISLYKRDGIDGLKEAKKNAHYSKTLKLSVVHAYLAGEGTLEELTVKYGLRNSYQLNSWISQYNGNKLTATPYRKQVSVMSRKTTFKERIQVVEYIVKHKHSYSEAADHFQVSYQQARLWVLKANDGGYEALVDNRGHRKSESELTDLDKANLRIRQLESQLQDQELYKAFAKKLQELQRKE
ncbi:helix-turn-helix domain-containing protein, partial [Pediococcus argentinicus]